MRCDGIASASRSGKSAMSSVVVWCEVDFGSGGGGVER
jgi:hypothetical protein